ncbi:DUF1330 domain-containing protein [Vibrio penaeicida]|uniref:DUF1330 domain-containing protein n=1 Tax=Vibrio penaeicida TaxID=104609 RepID=UPI000CEA29AA|nr:DUF1330 domain-containing protein [Vibrio penaeicida]
MAFEMLIGIEVSDEQGYRQYREAMMPILKSYGGKFGYDFVVSEVLMSPTPEPVNRVFTLIFSDEKTKEAFFADVEYAKVKERYFKPSVSSVTRISEYVKQIN